jgi:hypothetical protein
MSVFRYRAFGLRIASAIECPEFLSDSDTAAPEVRVIEGAVPESLEAPLARGVVYEAADDQLLLKLRGTARYLIQNGQEIVIQAEPGADPGAIRLFLYGSAFGALLYQRGLLPLHGSAVATPAGAVLFAGASGHGKSTLAGAMHRRGYQVLSDDVCAITCASGVPVLLPAYPRLMLWADAVAKLGLAGAGLTPARTKLEKYQLPVGQGFSGEGLPLRAVYLLNPTNAPRCSLEPVKGFNKIQELTDNTYRRQFMQGMRRSHVHFRHIGAVAQHARVARVERPDAAFQLEELADLIEQDLRA